MLPPRRKRKRDPKPGEPIRSPGHLRWVRGHMCVVNGCGGEPIEAAHVRVGTDGGMGVKPSDRYAVSMCSDHHREQHQIGELSFENRHGVRLRELADAFWKRSPHK